MSDNISLSAKDHFINVAAGNVQAAVTELDVAATDGMILMHNRDYYALGRAAQKYLGQDTLSEQLSAEWEALSTDEQETIKKSPTGYGKFSFFNNISQIEVPLALLVAAKLLSKDFKMGVHNEERLRDPKVVKSITTRFPIIREADITEALELK